MRRFIFSTDLHGDKQDSPTVKALHEFTQDFKPHDKIFGGDIFDLRPLRRGAGAEEQAESMLNDWTAGCEFLRQWKPNYVLEGNHDKRLYDLAENHTAGIKADYAMKGCIELAQLYGKLKCVVKPHASSATSMQQTLLLLLALTKGSQCLAVHCVSLK